MTFGNLSKKVSREIGKGYRKLLAPQGVRELPPEWPEDFSDFTKNLWRQISTCTMTSKERVAALEGAVRYIHASAIDGDFVECGVAAGGSVMAMAIVLQDLGITDRRIWLFDTFEGMPEPTEHDMGRFDTPAMKLYNKKHDAKTGWIKFGIDDVRTNVLTTGYPEKNLEFIKGKVQETLPTNTPEQIALLRLDTDWYESTKAEMEYLFPLLQPGGLILIDDYYRWKGSRKAVDEYTDANNIRIFWSRIDENAVLGVKQG
ncbi:MAG: macrocin O-methyltransferase [Alphaproteobacteria bacterium]|nr:macrocin O-methyltransferase [Alphaproteobacteria bacterium]